jgi:hypothetical protein
MTTLLFDERESQLDADERAGQLWIPLDRLEAATGWHESPRGLCRGERCIPVPPGARWVEAGRFDVSAFAAHRRQGLADFEGRLHSLSEQRGRKVLLMTWASW